MGAQTVGINVFVCRSDYGKNVKWLRLLAVNGRAAALDNIIHGSLGIDSLLDSYHSRAEVSFVCMVSFNTTS